MEREPFLLTKDFNKERIDLLYGRFKSFVQQI